MAISIPFNYDDVHIWSVWHISNKGIEKYFTTLDEFDTIVADLPEYHRPTVTPMGHLLFHSQSAPG